MTIRDDQGNQLLQQKLELNAVGAADGKLVLGPDAGLGYYYLSAQFDKEHEYGVGFQVAEYRKPEYELSAQSDKAEYTQGEQVNVTAQASYFFGGPVKGGKVRWVLSTGDASFQYTGKGYWSFEDYDWYEPNAGSPFGGQISQGEGVTDRGWPFHPQRAGRHQQIQARPTFHLRHHDPGCEQPGGFDPDDRAGA